MVPQCIRNVMNPRRRLLRWPLKLLILLGAVLAVTYPRPELLVRNIQHWRNLDALIDPACPALEPLAEELAPRLYGVPRGRPTLKVVQDFVIEKIPYAWDWETWGVLDYIPTVEETLRAGREDCDGRAVVAASLLRKLGYEAKLKSDLSHVWVWTPAGETMSPVQTASGMAVIAPTPTGSGVNWKAVFAWATLLRDVPGSVGYGIAVFPAWRELIAIAIGMLVLTGRVRRLGAEIAGLALLLAGWQVLRWTCADAWDRNLAGAWTGFGLVMLGIVVLVRYGSIVPAGQDDRTLVKGVMGLPDDGIAVLRDPVPVT